MKIRTTCPKNNKYYIRTVTGGLNGAVAGEPTQPYANVLDNCVGYANGRFNEIWNDPDLKGIVKAFNVQLTCNAENFIESAKKQGLKVSSTPVVGGIMVWQKGATLSGGDGAGHVAVVERVYDDGTILTSESGWASWAFKTVRRDNSNGRWSQNSYYKFRGCIINPNVKNVITPAPKLSVDGIGGTCTVRAMQRFFGTAMDGVLSGQSKAQSKYFPALTAVEYGKGGSPCVKKLQKWVGSSQDGVIGEQTVKAWQKKIGVDADGIFGANSMKAWQKYLNENDKAVYPIEKSTIGSLANEYAYSTDTSKADYKSGSPLSSYVAGLDNAYPDRSKWGTAPRKGASCDVFVGTCVRNAGIDKDFPRGLAEQIPHLEKSAKFKEVSVTVDTIKDGDIIIYTKTSGGGHICIAYGGKVKEAGFESYYPKTTNYLKTRLSNSGKNWLKVYRAVSEKEDPKGTYSVIDVSDWQGSIDWAKVKADGIDGAIIRYADGNTLDKRFAENMSGALKAGLHVGSYIFSRAKTKAEAEAEATRLFNACKPYKFDMPLYIDLEVATLAKYANVVAQAFLVKMKALGCRGGVYANLNWWNNYLADTAKNYSASPFWIAQYNDTMDYKPASAMGMWQYTSSGSVNGINGKVDRDKCYVAYWETAPKLVDQELAACKEQAVWMKDSKYEWQSNPTIEKSKTKGTCVTYVACVLQRLGILPSGKYIWHNEKGKVVGANDKMTVIYPSGKTLRQLKSELKPGDIIMDGDKTNLESGSHIFIITGEWSGNNPIVWDNHSAQGKKGKSYAYSRNRYVIAIVRLK